MEDLDLVELIELFWNKKVIIVIATVIGMIAGLIYSFNFVTPKYQSFTRLVLVQVTDTTDVGQNNNAAINASDITLNKNLVTTYGELIKSSTVLTEVKNELGIEDSEEQMKKNIVVTAVDETQVIKITVNNTDPKKASDIANQIAKVFDVKVRELYNISNISVLDAAVTSETPYNVNHLKDIVIFALAGVVSAIIIILGLNMLDNTIGSSKDIEDELGSIVLASIPECEDIKTKKRRGGRRYEK